MTDVCCIGQGWMGTWQVKVAVGYNEAFAGNCQIGEDLTLPLAVVMYLERFADRKITERKRGNK